jgi:hypothetical protein
MLTLDQYKAMDKVTLEQLDQEVAYYFEKAGDRRITCEQMDKIVGGIFQTVCRISGRVQGLADKAGRRFDLVMADHGRRQPFRLALELGLQRETGGG